MRKFIVKYLNILSHINDIWFLHCDVFNSHTFESNVNVLNLGITESSICNIAAGLSKQKKKVFIYSLCNYITHKGFESLYYNLGDWAQGGMIFTAGSRFCI